MKKIFLLFLFLLCLIGASRSQTFFWESFDAGVMPPPGWTLNGLPAQWSNANSNAAGGLAPEAKFTYVQQTTTTRMISPMVNLTGFTTVKFSFRYFYDWYSNPAPKIGVATRSHNGSWNTVWESTPTGNVGPIQKDLDINNSDVGQTEFQLCVYLNGNMYNLDYVYLDNMLLFNPLANDAGITSLGLTPGYFADPIEVKGTLMNFGNSAITSAEINWKLDDGVVHTTTVSGISLTLQQSYDFTCTGMLDAPIGAHNLTVWLSKVNGSPDDFRGNDTAMKVVNKVCNVIPKRPLFEEFTSSTCAPCASFNTGFVPWCTSHEEDITLVKYQMNWPGAGDPYYTAEGGVRKTYYGVNAVPDLYCNGGNVATDMGEVQTAYDQAIQEIGMMQLAATHTLNNKVITVDATVLPFSNFTACKVHIVVMEKVTHNNARSNGETSFHHVMMKLIPDGDGTLVNFTDRVPFTITDTVDLTGTNVEEWNDLIVSVFVQDNQSKKVYQSAYSVENGTFGTEARLASLTQGGQLVPTFNPDVFNYDVTLPIGTVSVPEVAAVPMDSKAVVIVVPTYTLPGTTTVDVFAENLKVHNQYMVNFRVQGVGTGEEKVSAIRVYPNPTRGMIYLLNATHARVAVTTGDGRTILTAEDFSSSGIDLSRYDAGIYILSIETPDHQTIRKKIVLY
jgi:hypothetical protein